MRRFVCSVVAAVVAAIGLSGGPKAQAQTKDEVAIRTLEDQFATAASAMDVDAIMKVYAPGDELLVFDMSTPRQYAGWDAYKKDWQDFAALFQGPVKFSVDDLSITTDGKLAYSHSIQHVSGTGKDGSKIEITVRVTDCYRKTDGKWLIALEHVSVPIDMTTGKPDMMSKP